MISFFQHHIDRTKGIFYAITFPDKRIIHRNNIKEDNYDKNNCKYHIPVNFIFRMSNIEKEMNKNK